MQWAEFKDFVSKIIYEGQRLQKVDITGRITTRRRLTQTQVICLVMAVLLCSLLPQGITDNFAEYAIAFLGIFVGLFTSILISLYDKGKGLYIGFSKKNSEEKARIELLRNYLVQFTGLTAYSIILALIIVVLLLGVLLFHDRKVDISEFQLVHSFSQINKQSIINFINVFSVSAFRIIVFYLLLNFFVITAFSLSSYFSFLLAEYQQMGIINADEKKEG